MASSSRRVIDLAFSPMLFTPMVVVVSSRALLDAVRC
jgi:hypothetical protein